MFSDKPKLSTCVFASGLLWVLITFYNVAFANVTIPNGGFGDQSNIFHLSNSKVQKEESQKIAVNLWNGAQLSPESRNANVCKAREQDGALPIISACFISSSTDTGSTVDATCTCNAFDPRFEPQNNSRSYNQSEQYTTASVFSCPPDDFPTYTTSVTDDATTVCFDPAQLDANDTCSNNPFDDDHVLPSNGSVQTNVCHTRSDGSRCGYTNSGEGYFVRDLESNCYIEQGDPYSFTPEAPPAEGTCTSQYGMYVCSEQPQNMCDGDTCFSSCGTVTFQGQSSFVCFSNDTDNDGLPDYSDPDIDGDGIANDQDLDADGDGLDDPDYTDTGGSQSPGSSQNITVQIDTSTLESLVATTNSRLNTTNSRLTEIDNSIGDVEQAVQEIGLITDTPKGGYESDADVISDIEAAELELQAELQRIKTEVDDLFSLNVPAGEMLGCIDISAFNGTTYQTCFHDMHDELQVVSLAIWLGFVFLSIVILMR